MNRRYNTSTSASARHARAQLNDRAVFGEWEPMIDSLLAQFDWPEWDDNGMRSFDSLVPTYDEVLRGLSLYIQKGTGNQDSPMKVILSSTYPVPKVLPEAVIRDRPKWEGFMGELALKADVLGAQLRSAEPSTDVRPIEEPLQGYAKQIEDLFRLDERQGRVDLMRHLMDLYFQLKDIELNGSRSGLIECIRMPATRPWISALFSDEKRFKALLSRVSEDIVRLASEWQKTVPLLCDSLKPRTVRI